jgi:hypothetical protein
MALFVRKVGDDSLFALLWHVAIFIFTWMIFLIYVQGYPKIRRMFIKREDITLIITHG